MRRRTKKARSKLLGFGRAVLLFIVQGLELGASPQRGRACQRQENSPVDCFAGGSREASP